MKNLAICVLIAVGFPQLSLAQKPAPLAPAIKMGDPLPANAFVELAKMINPAVVNISTSTMPRGRAMQRDPFYDMLERFYGMQMQPQAIRPQQALGTGFIIREDGLIVTNNHVTDSADVIQVQLSEGDKKYDAVVIGSDDRTDIALLKIKADVKLPVAKLGNSKDLMVGEWVAAFGNPFGQGHTMTKGIISAKGRDIAELNRFPLLQTDTPINPGNSGGPLVNLRGEVIGVNSAIDARAQGIGFAIPIDEVKSIIPQLEKTGRIKKAFLGVDLADLNPMAAAQLGLKDDEGAVVAGIQKGSPADKGGLRTYDVITDFNGKKIRSANDLRDAVADAPIDSKVTVKVVREGSNKTLSVSLIERTDSRRGRPKTIDRAEIKSLEAPHQLGFRMSEPNPALKGRYEIPDELANHPLILTVDPGTPADKAGLQPGDVILDVNRKEVNTSADVKKQLKKGTNTIRVFREGTTLIVVITSA